MLFRAAQPPVDATARPTARPRGVTLLALGAVLVVLSGFAALFVYAGGAVTGVQKETQTRLMERALARRVVELDASLAAFAASPAAEEAGSYLQGYFGHDLTVAFDPALRPVSAFHGGRRVPLASVAGFQEASRPLAARALSRRPAAGALKVGGDSYLAAAVVARPAARGVLVSAVKIDDGWLRALAQDAGGVRPRIAAAPRPGMPYVPLYAADGRTVAVIAWPLDRPGLRVLLRAKWPILAAATLLAALVAGLVLGLRRLTLDLLLARDLADTANRYKSAFIANISHEVRTPLNGILGMAHVMSMDDLSPLQRRRLDVVREAGASLLALLNDVLDMSKIQAGKVQLEAAPFDMEDLLRNACAAFSGLALAKDISLGWTVEPEAAGRWTGDALRLRQVICNLVSNAVKFTETGSVAVHVERCDDALRFSVSDTGIGLAPEELPELFSSFTQADASTTRRFGGTGLGLSICLNLVEMMGGAIEVESEKGRGSRFSFSLSLPRPAAPPDEAVESAGEPRLPSESDRSLRVLAAEDNATNRLVLKSLLEPLDVSLTMTVDGAEVLEAFKAGDFDLVLMDAQMPVLNGIDAARAIRNFEAAEGRAHTPILALSANVMPDQIAEYVCAGMDGYVAKPIDVAHLYAAIERALSSGETEPVDRAARAVS